MFTRSITDDSRSINDRSRVVRMMIISDSITWSITYNVILMTLEVSFTIVIFLKYRPQVSLIFASKAEQVEHHSELQL
jgi:hypothetical protein